MINFAKKIPIEAGWSADKKYCAITESGEKFLLRISAETRRDSRKTLHEMMKQVAALNIPMCRPVDFGECDDGVYMVQTWVDGDDLSPTLPTLPKKRQCALGLDAGRYLRQIHTIPAPDGREDWANHFNAKIDRVINNYEECDLHLENDTNIIDYITDNRHLLTNRPQSFSHGDYHVGNMMLAGGKLTIIDFDRFDFGDPLAEFNRIPFSARISPAFATGQIRGYFEGEPPSDFFSIMLLYVACNTLASLPWAIPFGQGEIDTMRKMAQDMLSWHDDMQNPVPSWYCGGKYD
ncbi:MAG: phosphotransferase [Defluviitaleaceae bacterium]|nr:phosphotransferase [Defluviitaleaceae bacterium]